MQSEKNLRQPFLTTGRCRSEMIGEPINTNPPNRWSHQGSDVKQLTSGDTD